MAGPNARKRSHQDYTLKGRIKAQRPLQKFKKQKHYHSDSDEADEKADENDKGFKPVDLLDSEDDLDNAVVDDGASSSNSGSDSQSDQSDSEGDDDKTSTRDKLAKRKVAPTKAQSKAKKTKQANDKDVEESDSEDEQEENDEFDIGADDDDDDDSAEDDSDNEDGTLSTTKKPKSKRNDPGAFATSLSKILSTKLPTTRRADPVLSRSVEAHKAAQAITDSALESKAKKQLRAQKLAALEKGRVRNVLVATRNEATGEPEASTAEVMEKERQLRKVAQRGVVKLFNAVRAAQVRGIEAEREARKEGFVGVTSRKEKVTDMSRKGFLDLIASGGGDLKKGPIEEA